MNVTVQQLKKKSNKLACMSEVWNGVTKDYELKQRVGLGSYGEVVAATHISSGKLVAIKLINNVSKNEYETKKVLREI